MYSQPDIRHAPIEHWRIAQWLLNVIYNLFGEPKAIAAQHTLTAKAHKLMASWLRTAEALMRRLLLMEAAALKLTYASCPTKTRARARSAKPEFDPENPDSWRVSLRCFLDRRRPAGGAAGRPRKEKRFYSAWPLAKRYQAMIRVFNEPLRYARRLTRRLNAEPHRAAELLRAPPEYERRTEAPVFDQDAERARRCWDSS